MEITLPQVTVYGLDDWSSIPGRGKDCSPHQQVLPILESSSGEVKNSTRLFAFMVDIFAVIFHLRISVNPRQNDLICSYLYILKHPCQEVI
jgi:hypothetical protein